MAERPTGTVTFLFTDLERSTRLWEEERDAMPDALRRHDELLQVAIEGNAGYRVKGTGDGVHAAFSTAEDAIAATVAAQTALAEEDWGMVGPLRVRMGIHTGSAELRDDDYFGPALNRAARLMAAAHGGQIVISNATEELVRDALPFGVDLEDLGEHHLRDLTRPERVFQVHAPELPSLFPPLRSLAGERTNLPAPTTSFVGRERVLDEIVDALRAARIVTLTGVGGVGKTRLALETAVSYVPHVEDGCWLVELAPVVDGDALVEVVAAALGVKPRPDQSLTASVAEYLRTKQLLLVLDNCEHLLDEAARFVDDLLATSPAVQVLATSREGLGVAGERILAVPSMDLPRDDDDSERIGGSEAARLFVAHAAESKAGFTLTEENVAAVCRLVRRLDGIPLAIELAAARVRSLTPAELADRVDERFRLLAGGRRTAVERHQTLRRAIDWSYDLLEPPEQIALQRAAVFAGDLSVSAAEEVLAGDEVDEAEVVDLMTRLVDKSLVVAEDHEGRTRYRVLETIRSYAQERLEATADAEQVRRRHAEHYVAFANEAATGLRGRDEAEWNVRVSAEVDNLRAAVTWAVDQNDVDLALGIVAPLAIQGTSVGYAASPWSETVLRMEGAAEHVLYAEVLAWGGWAAVLAGEFERGEALGRQALASADATPRTVESTCRVFWPSLGVVAYVGDADTTLRIAHRMAELARSIPDDYYLANACTFLAIASDYKGDGAAQRRWNDEAVSIARRGGNPSSFSYAAVSGVFGCMRDDPDRARSLADEALDAAMSVDNLVAIGMAIASSSLLDLATGQLDDAARRLLRAIDYAERVRAIAIVRGQCVPVAVTLLETSGAAEAAAMLSETVLTNASAGASFVPFLQSVEDLRERLGDERFALFASRGKALNDDELCALLRRELESYLANSADAGA